MTSSWVTKILTWCVSVDRQCLSKIVEGWMRREKNYCIVSCLLWILTVTAKPCQGQNQLPKNNPSLLSLIELIIDNANFFLVFIQNWLHLFHIPTPPGRYFLFPPFHSFISLAMFSWPAFLFARWLMIDGQWTSNIPWSVSARRTSRVLVGKVPWYSNTWVTARQGPRFSIRMVIGIFCSDTDTQYLSNLTNFHKYWVGNAV